MLCFKRILLYLIITIGAISCAPVRTVVPLEKGSTHVSASIGGPLIEFSGLVIPIPLTSVNVAHGLTENLTVNTALHTTSLLFGVMHIEGSLTKNIYKNTTRHYGISSTPGFYFMIDRWEWNPKFYPMLDMNFYVYPTNKNHLLYCSLQQIFELSSKKAFEQKVTSWYIPSLAAGYIWDRPKMNYTLELKYMNFLQSNRDIVVEYIAPGNKGTFGFQIGITRKF